MRLRPLPLTAFYGLPIAALILVVLFFAYGWPFITTYQARPTPRQPVEFDHRVHVQVAGIDCLFCHRTAAEGVVAGIPDLQQCMACHQVVGRGRPEIEKVRQAWLQQTPIDWVRIHRLPDHTHFVHEAHIRAGLTCAACHGDVAQMSQVTQVRPLHMSDCVACHQQMKAPTDCLTCHR
jgi:hypothetical protein